MITGGDDVGGAVFRVKYAFPNKYISKKVIKINILLVRFHSKQCRGDGHMTNYQKWYICANQDTICAQLMKMTKINVKIARKEERSMWFCKLGQYLYNLILTHAQKK